MAQWLLLSIKGDTARDADWDGIWKCEWDGDREVAEGAVWERWDDPDAVAGYCYTDKDKRIENGSSWYEQAFGFEQYFD